ncbi:MAG: hypothetical protein WC634_00835 [archaeon]
MRNLEVRTLKTTCGKVTAFFFVLFLVCLSQVSLASPGDFISLDPSTCGTWGGGKHCWHEQNVQGITNVDFIISFDKPVAFGDGNTYVVPIMTLMSITNFVSYINVCVDGASAPDAVLPADILVDGEKVGDNYIKTNVESCHGGTVWKGNQGPVKYLFSKQGLHHVQIVVASQNNGTCGVVSREFDVIVVHPVLSVNGSASRIISFGRNEAEKAFNIIWTIKNLGGFASTLETVTATGCGENLECNFIAFGPLDLNPNESIIVVEEVKAKRPAAITAPVAVEELGIELGYIDIFGLSRLNKQSSLPVNVALLWNEEQRFHVELVGGQQDYCIGQDGKLGGTGPGEVPHVLFNWAWSSIGINEPGAYSCDKKSPNDLEYIYCDPTQFSIELLKRLNMIKTAAEEGKFDKAAELSHFQAYLIGDSINPDFRKDFDYYYKTTEFFGADWYNSPNSPWDLYFTDTQRMVFSPEKIDSGLYDVELDFDFESDKYKFFWSENELAAKITVRLTKISNPLSQNPLYYLPFNGEVGLQRIDEDGLARRNGYGLGFSGDELRLDEFRLGSFILTKGEGEKIVQTAYMQDFYKSNISEKGLILSIAKDGSSMVFSPSYATPVIMELKANEATARADGYYSVHNGAKTMVSPSGYMNLWTGFASTPMTCANFDESSLYYQRNDGTASEVPGLATTPENPAYGFTWKDVPAQNLQQGKLYLETVFYTPIDSGMTLSGESTTVLMSPSGTGQAVSLNYKGMSPIIESVFGLVNDKYVCVSLSDSALEFWWNPQRVTKDLDGIKAAQISEAWMSGCSVEGEAK